MLSQIVRRYWPYLRWANNSHIVVVGLVLFSSVGLALLPAVAQAQSTPAVLPPSFSVPRGFYAAPFQVTLSTATVGATIRYTTDGATPSSSVGTIYSGPIDITTTTPLRAIAYKDSARSAVVTHTYLFRTDIIRQNNTPPGYPAFFAPTPVDDPNGPYPADYEMDPEVVDNPAYSGLIDSALTAIPSLSIVTDIANLFDTTTGIYYNSLEKGSAWERPISIEWINGDGSTGFAENGGLRMHGQASRTPWRTPKRSMRIYFKAGYGTPKLDFPVFKEATAVQKFDRILLKGGSNRSWPYWEPAQRADADYVNDEFPRIAFREMGHLTPHGGTYVHLYLNGLYWGLYDITERIDEKYLVAYLGGAETNYDLIEPDEEAVPRYTPTPIVGTIDAWNQLLASVEITPVSASTYNQVLTQLDVVDLADYIILTHYVGNTDWPMHNWYTYRKRSGPDTRFRFIPWDNDTGLRSVVHNVTLADAAGSPAHLFLHLITNPDFKQLVSDRLTLHATGNGILTPVRCVNRYTALTDIIDYAIIGESARWGDYQRDVYPKFPPAELYTRNDFWLPLVKDKTDVYCRKRTETFVSQYLANGWYLPNPQPAVFSQNGGAIATGGSVTINNPASGGAGDIYYTTDGTDPRALGGEIAPGASAGGDSVGVTINGVTTVQARIKNGTDWSAPWVVTFYPPQDFSGLVINELHYHPLTAASVDGDLYEFIELYNGGATALRLDDLTFSRGITYKFPVGTTLAPGSYLVLASDYAQFQATYGVAPFAAYAGNLSNSGEAIELVDALGTVIDLVDYADLAPWPVAADGAGPSLELTSPTLDNSLAPNWKASTVNRGTPSAPNSVLAVPTPPAVAISSPANPAIFLLGSTLMIEATASDVDGNVTQVAFFINDVPVSSCIVTVVPYSCAYTLTAPGAYSLSAKATDNQGLVATAPAVNITVRDPSNQPPSVSIVNPANGAIVPSSPGVLITATASDSDDSISQVVFFVNGTPIENCVDTSAPYECTWLPTAPGHYSLTAQITDNRNAITLSSAVNVTVQEEVTGQDSVRMYLPLIIDNER